MPLTPAPSDWNDYEFRGKVVYLDDIKGLIASLEKFGDVEIQVDHNNGALTTSVVEDLSDIEGRDLYSVHVAVQKLGMPVPFAEVRIGGIFSKQAHTRTPPMLRTSSVTSCRPPTPTDCL